MTKDSDKLAMQELYEIENELNDIEGVLNVLEGTTGFALQDIDTSTNKDTLEAVGRLYGVLATIAMLRGKTKELIERLDRITIAG